MLQETIEEEAKKEVSRKFLPRNYYCINAYFLDTEKNPEDIRGKVMWMSVPKTIYDIFDACMHSDDPGDDEYPKAYGMFYDVTEGYVFKLTATKKGDWNTYEASRFLASKGPTPLLKSKTGKLNEAGIKDILAQRHDLATKFQDRDQEKVATVVKKLLSDDDDNGFDKDEEKADKETKTKTSRSSKPKAKPKDDDDDVVEEVKDEDPSDSDEVADDTPEEDDEELANLLDSIKASK